MFISILILVLLALGLAAPYFYIRQMEKQMKQNLAEFQRQLKEQARGKN